ncbi:MAG: hypothetical protein HKN92_03495 [Chitinophagales bacterium]|nr:hypothetical protein [Chitinophagales bacterium]
MTTTAVNYLNIGLMFLAAAIAFVLPFELFLFAYAVLGPLHYLTEIHWLHERKYFTNNQKDYFLLVFLCVFVFLFSFVFKEGISLVHNLIFIAFFSALAMVLFKKFIPKLIFLVVLFFSALVFSENRAYLLFFAVFLPTIIHVFIFTGAFILYGAMKSRSFSGIASLIVFIVLSLSFFLWKVDFDWYATSSYVQKSFVESGFHNLNIEIMNLVQIGSETKSTVLTSSLGMSVMRFIAFAYTYHYLNWFSKTSIIGWHKISRRNLAILVLIWLLSIGLYAYNYKTGLIALYFLSMLHVFLEFPLNYRSFIGIGSETLSLFGYKPAIQQGK